MLLLALTGCNGDGTPSTTTLSVDTSTTTGTGTTSTSGGNGDDPIEYVDWGPDDPPIPGQYAALAASSSRPPNCGGAEELGPSDEFWRTVVAVCRALAGDGEWPSTTSSPAPPEAENDFQDCLNGELAAMVDDALGWHQAHPGRAPEITYPSPSSLSACQTRIHGADVFPATGGVVVELSVPGLDDDGQPEVRIDGEPVEVTDDFDGPDDGLSKGEVFLQAPIEAHTATLDIETRFGRLSTTIDLPNVEEDGEATTTTDDPGSDGETTTTGDPGSDGETTTTTA